MYHSFISEMPVNKGIGPRKSKNNRGSTSFLAKEFGYTNNTSFERAPSSWVEWHQNHSDWTSFDKVTIHNWTK